MSRLRRNILANLVGRGWSSILGILMVPVYLRFLGIEAYGLIGVIVSLQAVLGVLDMGFGHTLNREMARLSGDSDNLRTQRNLLRTLEGIYWIASIGVGTAVVLGAHVIVNQWIQPEAIDPQSVRRALQIGGVLIAVHLPSALYSGGLMGLERQVLLNGVQAVHAGVRAAGSILVLWQVSASVEALLVWHAITAAVATAAMGFLLWRQVELRSSAPQFDLREVHRIWGYTVAISVNAVIALLLTQLDRIVLSGLLTLEFFGYYMIASTVATGLWSIIMPVNGATFPRFVKLIEQRNQAALIDLYHSTAQFVAVLLFPIAAMLGVFAYEVVLLWTGDATTASHTSLIAALLVTGTTVAGVTSVAAYAQVASGRPQLVTYTNAISAVVLVPLLLYGVNRYGAPGAAMVWVLLNLGHLCFMVPLILRRIMPGEFGAWLLRDVTAPLMGVLALTVFARAIAPSEVTALGSVFFLGGIWSATSMTALVLAPRIRTGLLGRLGLFRPAT